MSVRFIPILDQTVFISLYYQFEDELPVFIPVTENMLDALHYYYDKAIINKLDNNKYSIYYDRFKMCYNKKQNILTISDEYIRNEFTTWNLDSIFSKNLVKIRNNRDCVTYKDKKTISMEKCDTKKLDQIFIAEKHLIKMHCHYDENCSDEITINV
ncbi:hypothetical protein COBT_000726 [Conglomerata obtusa]